MARLDPSHRTAIELHDSTIGAMDIVEGNLAVHFAPAYIHRSAGVPGADSGTGWSQNAVMIMSGVRHVSQLPPVPAEVSDGELEVDGRTHKNVLDLVAPFEGEVCLRLTFDNGCEFEVRGDKLELKLEGDARFVEYFDASSD
jgi:hypothetical protein